MPMRASINIIMNSRIISIYEKEEVQGLIKKLIFKTIMFKL